MPARKMKIGAQKCVTQRVRNRAESAMSRGFMPPGPKKSRTVVYFHASSLIATARVQPAEPPRIFTGKQLTVNPVGRQRLEIVQLLDMAIADLAAGLVALPDQARRSRVAAISRLVWTNGASQLQPSVPVTRTPRSSR